MTDDVLDALIHRADLDGLVRLVDGYTAAGDWEALARAGTRARAAVETGRQLWPIATLTAYRLALWAPAEWAATVLDGDRGRFAIGPLTEVIAQHHRWDEVAELLDGPEAAVVAHERALRGDVVDAATVNGPNPLELPFELAAWEPQYPLATYSDDGVEARTPQPAVGEPVIVGPVGAVDVVDDATTELALRLLVEPWTAQSDGTAALTCVEGTVGEAIAAAALTQATLTPIDLADALAVLAWAGASSGRHGRRRGAALGRFSALWLLAALVDRTDEWPLEPDELGASAAVLRWYVIGNERPAGDWELRLAVEDPADGVAWVLTACD